VAGWEDRGEGIEGEEDLMAMARGKGGGESGHGKLIRWLISRVAVACESTCQYMRSHS
jgi:hypothetical protein